MSQPPSPYDRQFSFTGWSIAHPNEPHQGDKVDLELNEIKQSLDETQARLAEIQRDDGLIRAEALSPGLQALVDDAAAAAATAVYATNLAQLSDKALARSNLQLPSYYSLLSGTNVWGWEELPLTGGYANNIDWPVSPLEDASIENVYVKQAGQAPQGLPYQFPVGSYQSRVFRASVVAGSLLDYGTWYKNDPAGTPPVPSILPRIDNICAAINAAGSIPPDGFSNGGTNGVNLAAGFFSNDYTQMANLPSLQNPLASIVQIADAMNTHYQAYDHGHIPDGIVFGLINSLTENGVAGLSASVATYADPVASVGQVESVKPYFSDGYLHFTAQDGLVYKVAAELVT